MVTTTQRAMKKLAEYAGGPQNDREWELARMAIEQYRDMLRVETLAATNRAVSR